MQPVEWWKRRCGLVDDSFKFKVVLKDTLSELLVVETFTPLKTYLIVTYRRELKSSKNAREWLTDELNNKLNEKTNVITCGDFSIDLLVVNKHHFALRDIRLSHNLKLVSPLEVTRHDENSESCLDHIYSDMKISENKVFQSSITDHYMVFTQFAQTFISAKQLSREYRDLNQLNKKHILSAVLEDIQSRLSRVDSESEHLDNAVFYLPNAIKEATEKYIPLKPDLTKKKFWVDNSVKRSINKRNDLYRIYKIDPSNPITKEAFERQRRETKALLRSKKRGFIQANFEKTFGDMKMFHRQLNDIIGKVNEEIQPSLSETKTIDDFNSYFVNVGLNNQRTIEHVEFNMNQSSRQMQSVFLRPISADEIQSIIGKLKNKTSTGPFGISNKLLKVCESVVSPILATMINRCMSIGYFPEWLKVAKVVPIYKAGDRDTFSNYRPISLLSPISKIFKRLIYSRIYSYIEKFDLLSDNQFGSRKKRKQSMHWLVP